MQYKICHTYGMNAISMKYIPMRYDIHTSFVAVLSLLLRAGSRGGVVSRAPDSSGKESGNFSRVSVCQCRNVDTTI